MMNSEAKRAKADALKLAAAGQWADSADTMEHARAWATADLTNLQADLTNLQVALGDVFDKIGTLKCYAPTPRDYREACHLWELAGALGDAIHTLTTDER